MAGCGVGDRAGGQGWGTGGLPLHFFPTDILQKTSIGATEPSGFTKAFPRGDNVLPALSTQPVSPHPAMSLVTPRQPPKSSLHPRGHFFPPTARCQCHQNGLSALCAQPRKQDRGGDTRQGWGTGRGHPYHISVPSQGDEALPELSGGSERGSGFTREVPNSLGTVVSRTLPVLLPCPCVPSPSSLAVPNAGFARGGSRRPIRVPRAAGTARDTGQAAGTAEGWQDGGCRCGTVPNPVPLPSRAIPIPVLVSIPVPPTPLHPPGAIGLHHQQWPVCAPPRHHVPHSAR